MKYNSKTQPIVCMQTQSTCYKGTRTMTVKGVLWHSTGANNPSLKRYVQPSDDADDRADMLALLGTNANGNDWNHVKKTAGLNAWIGKLADGTVAAVQTMPWNYRPWGCGSGTKGSCNDGWIQFEICEDALSNRDYAEKVYREAVELTAYLCSQFGIDPNGTVTWKGVKVPTILCHHDSYKLGLGSNHADVTHWLPKFGMTMATARADVAALLAAGNQEETEDDADMTKEEIEALVQEKVTEALANAPVTVYNTIDEVPDWAKPEVQEAIDLGILKGNGAGLGLTEEKLNSVLLSLRAAKAFSGKGA